MAAAISEVSQPALELHGLDGPVALVAGLLYGSGLRLMEALRLRVQDLEFSRRELIVRDGKDRRTLLPERVSRDLMSHLAQVREIHRQDLADGWGRVLLPLALAASIHRFRLDGAGNGCFRNAAVGVTKPQGSKGAIISTPA